MLRVMVMMALVGASTSLAGATLSEEDLEPVAEAIAIATVCDELDVDGDELFRRTGITKREFIRSGQVFDFVVMRGSEYERDFKALNRDGVCARGRYYFGREGTKAPGLLRSRTN